MTCCLCRRSTVCHRRVLIRYLTPDYLYIRHRALHAYKEIRVLLTDQHSAAERDRRESAEEQGANPADRQRHNRGRGPTSVRQDPSCSKRRFQAEDEGPAVKLYMSEEVVSARLQRLSLENDHNYGGNGLPKMSARQESQEPESRCPDPSTEDDNVILDPGEFSLGGCNVISVCPLLEETMRDPRPESIIPESLLRSLSSPCLELVLWSPPSGPIHQLLRSLASMEDRCSRREVEEAMQL